MEAVRQGYLQAFALPPERLEELLAEMDTNRVYGQHQSITKPPSLD
jgi:hypothetical protein